MLLEEGAIGEAIAALNDLSRPFFWSDKHQKLYEHIVDLWKLGHPLDGVVIKDELQRKQMFEELGGYEFLAGLIGSVPSAQRVGHYARIVRDKHLLRQLVNASWHVMNRAMEDAAPAQQILDEAEAAIFNVTQQRVTNDAGTLMQHVDELFRRIELKQKHEGEATGFYALDEITSGLHKSELIIVAGRPSMGKTALGLNIAENMALRPRDPVSVLFFSLEMSRAALAERILCGRAHVDAHRLRKARLSAEEIERLKAAAGDLKDKPLYVDDTPGLTILELRARARIAARKFGIRVVMVDYLQLMHSPGKESRQMEVAEISRGLKAVAKDLDVPVIAMAQLNRNPEERTGNRPRMSDLRESGAIEQDADVIMLLHRESYYQDRARAAGSGDGGPPAGDIEDNKAEVIVAKQRNGPTGTVELLFNRRYTRFENYDPAGVPRFEQVREAEYGSEEGVPF